MIQIPVQPLTWQQQIMPYLVMLCVTIITSLIAVVKVYADKLILQLKANKDATQSAADSANAASTLAASTAIAVAQHNTQASRKLDTIIQQTNGVNEKLQTHIEDQQKVIEKLTSPTTPA